MNTFKASIKVSLSSLLRKHCAPCSLALAVCGYTAMTLLLAISSPLLLTCCCGQLQGHAWFCWAVLQLCLLTEQTVASECESLRRPQFPHCSPVKFHAHPEQGPVTVILLNFNRPENIRKIVDNMVTYHNVAEIMVVSNNPNNSFTYSHDKVVVLDMMGYEDELGVAVRFKACLLAMNWHILIADDDLMVTEAGLSKMLRARHEHPWSIVSFWGRDYDSNNITYAYTESGPGHHGIALTKSLLLDTCACRAFWEASHLMHDLAHEAAVTWNGEDIFMSLVSQKVLGGTPYIAPFQEGIDLHHLTEGE
ncbi:hypothetical protein MMC14_009965, partial [Varicellaria rhodocarpa]|nr:hypothetical protein [Varicellaria rhodocarpa]